MNPTITAFAQSPDRGRGLARDMAVRWALEEVGQPYDVRLLSFAAMKEPSHRMLQPFGQIRPTRTARSRCSSQPRLSFMSRSATRDCCPTMPAPARERSRGCSRRRVR
jgi:hypothetical protein